MYSIAEISLLSLWGFRMTSSHSFARISQCSLLRLLPGAIPTLVYILTVPHLFGMFLCNSIQRHKSRSREVLEHFSYKRGRNRSDFIIHDARDLRDRALAIRKIHHLRHAVHEMPIARRIRRSERNRLIL